MTTPDEIHGPTGRISPRHAFEARIQILLERDGQGLTVQGWTRNLSESGVNAFVAHSLSLGEFVMLEIPFPDAASHDIPAQVVRALGTEYGFQFTALSVEQRQQIQTALQGNPVIPYQRP
jgi:hypothetical protein